MGRIPTLSARNRRSILASVTGNAPITAEAGIRLTVRTRGGLTPNEIATIADSRTLSALLSRTMKNLGSRMVRRAQDIVRRLDAIDTRLFISTFRTEIAASSDVKTEIALVNDAPYAAYIHPKGRRARILPREFGPKSAFVAEMRQELIDDLDSIRPKIARVLKAKALEQARRVS